MLAMGKEVFVREKPVVSSQWRKSHARRERGGLKVRPNFSYLIESAGKHMGMPPFLVFHGYANEQ